MELFKKKNCVQILIFLLNNQNSINSKYKLKKSLELSNTLLNKCLEVLSQFKLIETLKNIGPRNRTEIRLTKVGINIAQTLDKILSSLMLSIKD